MSESLSPTGATRTPYRTRLSVLFAAEAPLAVILRRGPKRHWRLILWHLDDDTFTPGQWLKGEVALTDLSPDGTRLIYRVAQYHPSAPWRHRTAGTATGFEPLQQRARRPKRAYRKIPRYLGGGAKGRPIPRENTGTWTAISRAPWFSALAIWPAYGKWTGGGTFAGRDDIMLYETEEGMSPLVNVPMPATVRVHRTDYGQGWHPSARHPAFHANDERLAETWAALESAGVTSLDWIAADTPGGGLVYSAGGRILRLPVWCPLSRQVSLADVREIADFRDMHFELIAPPPEAMRW